jgi:hypothetical protein
MKSKVVISLTILWIFLGISIIYAQTTIHVQSTRSTKFPLRTFTLYTVDFGNQTLILESTDKRQPMVGQNYEVKKITATKIILLIPGKKKLEEVKFDIRSAKENKQKQNK